MTTVNLKEISNDNFKAIIKNLIGTDCTIYFNNHTEEHIKIALSIGLTISRGDILTIASEADHAGNYYQ